MGLWKARQFQHSHFTDGDVEAECTPQVARTKTEMTRDFCAFLVAQAVCVWGGVESSKCVIFFLFHQMRGGTQSGLRGNAIVSQMRALNDYAITRTRV